MTRYAQGFKGPMTPAAGPRVSTAPAQTAQTAPRGTPPPKVRPAGMNPNFKGFGAGPTSFNTDKINQVQGLLKGNAMKKGGTAHSDVKMDKKVVKKAVGMHEKQLHGGKKSDMSKLKSGGMSCAPKKMARGGGVEIKGKTKGTMVKMKKSGKC